MKDTLDMAFEAKLICAADDPVTPWSEVHDMTDELKAFEALVRADEREAFAKIQFESIFQAIRSEREACLNCYSPDDTAMDWADKIRARSNT